MCQLTFTDLGSPIFNSNYLIIQSYINTLTDHKDGFGFFTEPDIIKKTEIAPSNCTNLGSFIGQLSKDPIMSHVRKATYTNGAKIIDESKSHPFQSDNLILMHNGVLELKTSSPYDKINYGDKIDSEIFLEVLELKYKEENGDLVLALQKGYKEFNGKFAFVIYEKPLKKYYIIRGESAALHKKDVSFDGKRIGFIVNTDKKSLEDAFLLFVNLMLIKKISMDWNDGITELNPNSIYEYDRKIRDIKYVDKLEETKKETTAYAWNGYKSDKGIKDKKIEESDQLINDTFNLCATWGIDLKYLDELLYHTVGNGILSCSREDIVFFMDKIVPTINNWTTNKNNIKEWRKISGLDIGNLELHDKYAIQFPYLLETDIKLLRDIRRNVHDGNIVQ